MAPDNIEDADLDEPEDLGEPIEELRLLDEVPSTGFATRLRNALRRRNLSSQMVTLSWTGLGTVILEFFQVMFSIFETNERDEGGEE